MISVTVSRRKLGISSERGDQLLDPFVVGLERVLAQHRALRLVVELQVHPVDREVATALLCPVTQTLKRVITNLVTKGVSGNDPEEMIPWRKEVEDLIGLEEYYRIEADTVEK